MPLATDTGLFPDGDSFPAIAPIALVDMLVFDHQTGSICSGRIGIYLLGLILATCVSKLPRTDKKGML
ncbi:hypothetical protein Y5S_02740 [Alcanivorax nanhaiticus]|uniref:Uncharacterized protein n=1 Tax=Alcanivorax nanhaiticus TaxID=1177154 RepID=A0A095SHF1_9GAMM|nr:hypothetical protein Y5S_02740 [Alcanivorax nanhaiticus]